MLEGSPKRTAFSSTFRFHPPPCPLPLPPEGQGNVKKKTRQVQFSCCAEKKSWEIDGNIEKNPVSNFDQTISWYVMFLNVTIPVIRVMWSQYLGILKLAANSESYNRCTVVLLYYVGNETKKNHLTFPKQNKLKEYPNTPQLPQRRDRSVCWNCGLEVYGWDISTTHATSNPRTRLGDKWREPSKDFSETTSIWEKNVESW